MRLTRALLGGGLALFAAWYVEGRPWGMSSWELLLLDALIALGIAVVLFAGAEWTGAFATAAAAAAAIGALLVSYSALKVLDRAGCSAIRK